ncbi:MAG TPA: hypothetical protein VFE55_17545 [Acidimicrobiia bacterium]|nr:hypothetical protein [Acidimicrobiia bacterium]
MTALTALALFGPVAPARSAPAGRSRDPQRPSRHSYRSEPADAGMPARFVAELDGQLVVVSADTGRIQRRLTAEQPGGGAASPAITANGRTVWFTRGDGTCAAHIASVPAAGTSAERPLPGSGDDGPELFPLPRPGHAQLALTRYRCSDGTVTLVVGDLRGVESHGQTGLIPRAWSRDGAHLLAINAKSGGLRLLDVNNAGGVVSDQPVNPADPTPGCSLNVVGFSPDDNDGYVAVRHCGAGGNGDAQPTLVLLDRTGAVRQTVLRLARGEDFGAVVAFDQSGHSLLYSTVAAGNSAAGQTGRETLWAWRDGTVWLLARQNPYHGAAWLP